MDKFNEALEKSVKKNCERKNPIEITKDPFGEGYVISLPYLPGCLTCGDSLREALENAEDAKAQWIESELEACNDIPLPAETKRAGKRVINYDDLKKEFLKDPEIYEEYIMLKPEFDIVKEQIEFCLQKKEINEKEIE